MENNSESSCLNDPNFAIICAFLQKFATKLNIVYPDFSELQKMIENTDEVPEDLKILIVKLLRKIRRTVHNDKWEQALSKFCYTYSAQDAWEIERFGFKKSNLSVKLRVIKEILEFQFDRNLKFKTELNLLSADELRSQPIGKDKLGNSYWSTIDKNLNLRIYQEHLDEEIWTICAHNRDGLAKLITCLKGNELVMPSMVGLIDEDSNSMPQEKLDALKNGNVDSDSQNKVKTDVDSPMAKEGEVSENLKNDVDHSDEDDDDDDDESNISEMEVSSQDASECSAPMVVAKTNAPAKDKLPPLVITKTVAIKSMAKTETTNPKLSNKRTIESESSDDLPSKVPKLQRPTLLSKNQTIKTNKFAHLSGGEDDGDDDEDDSEEEEEEEGEEEEEEDEDEDETEDETDDDEVGEEIVKPVLHVKGIGSGKAN